METSGGIPQKLELEVLFESLIPHLDIILKIKKNIICKYGFHIKKVK